LRVSGGSVEACEQDGSSQRNTARYSSDRDHAVGSIGHSACDCHGRKRAQADQCPRGIHQFLWRAVDQRLRGAYAAARQTTEASPEAGRSVRDLLALERKKRWSALH